MSRYRKTTCMRCGSHVTTNSLGRASHMRSAACDSRVALWTRTAESAQEYVTKYGLADTARTVAHPSGDGFTVRVGERYLASDGHVTGRVS